MESRGSQLSLFPAWSSQTGFLPAGDCRETRSVAFPSRSLPQVKAASKVFQQHSPLAPEKVEILVEQQTRLAWKLNSPLAPRSFIVNKARFGCTRVSRLSVLPVPHNGGCWVLCAACCPRWMAATPTLSLTAAARQRPAVSVQLAVERLLAERFGRTARRPPAAAKCTFSWEVARLVRVAPSSKVESRLEEERLAPQARNMCIHLLYVYLIVCL